MTLGELIEALEQLPQDATLVCGIAKPHPYRGDYSDLAFIQTGPQRVADALALARAVVGRWLVGWKGGLYRMSGYADVWLAEPGKTSEQPLCPRRLVQLVAPPPREAAP